MSETSPLDHGASENKEIVSISFERRRLGEFIASLLGQRRRMSRSFKVKFDIRWNWLYHLDEIIVQRVEHQNDGTLVDFSFKLYTKNGRITHLIPTLPRDQISNLFGM
jgi:hypothetical protein